MDHSWSLAVIYLNRKSAAFLFLKTFRTILSLETKKIVLKKKYLFI